MPVIHWSGWANRPTRCYLARPLVRPAIRFSSVLSSVNECSSYLLGGEVNAAAYLGSLECVHANSSIPLRLLQGVSYDGRLIGVPGKLVEIWGVVKTHGQPTRGREDTGLIGGAGGDVARISLRVGFVAII